MLNKYLQIIITIGVCGEGKTKGREMRTERVRVQTECKEVIININLLSTY